MDLEVKGVAASPRRRAQTSLRGEIRQGWKPDTRATHGTRPPEVPCLDLGRLGDSDEEDEDYYIPYSGSYPYTCSLDSSSNWRTLLQTPYAQHDQAQQVSRKSCQKKTEHSGLEQKTTPENLPSPSDRYKLKYRQYEAEIKEEYKQYSQRTAEKKKDRLQCPEASIKGTHPEDEHNEDVAHLDEKALLQQCHRSEPYNMQHSIRKIETSHHSECGCCTAHVTFIFMIKSFQKANLRAVKKFRNLEDKTKKGAGVSVMSWGILLCFGFSFYVTKDDQHLIRDLYSEWHKEDVAAERRKQAVVEQVMVDQLSRAVISDPEQSMHGDVCKEAHGLLGFGTAPMRFRKRTLHETKIRTKSGLTENMLSNKLRFDSRIISRNGHDACRELIGFFFACDRSLTVYEFRQFGKNRTNALPFIQKGVYQHQCGQKKGKAYELSDFYIGANLTFRSVDHNLPESVKQNPVLTLRVISIDEAALDFLKASSMEFKQEYSEQVVNDGAVFKRIQGILRETLSKRGVRVMTGLGKYFRQIDKNRNGFLSQAAFKEALKVFHLELPEGDFESLWLVLDDSKSDKVDYGEFTRAVFGEMNEYRKAFVRKAYMKLDFNKTGSVPMVDIRKCYCAKRHPLVLAGKATEEEIKSSFLETLGESCSNPNEVSYSEFEDYYEGLSIGIMDDDDFVNTLRNPWGI